MRGMRRRPNHPPGRPPSWTALLLTILLLASACAATGRTLPEPVRALPEPRRFSGPEPFDEQARLDLSRATRLIHEARFEEATPIIDQLCADVAHADNHPRFVVMQGAFQLKSLLAYLSGDPAGGAYWLTQGYQVHGVMWGASWEDATERLILDQLHYAMDWPAARRSDLYLWTTALFDQLGQPEQELVYARLAAESDTSSARKAYVLANALLRCDRPQESLPWFRSAVEHGLPEAEVLSDYGVALSAAGRDVEARGVLERAVALEPDDFNAAINLVIACYLGEDLAAAEAVYQAAWKHFRSQRRLLRTASLYFLIDGGRDDEAWRNARAAGREYLLSRPHSTALWVLALEVAGRHPEAVDTLRRLVEREPVARDLDHVSGRWFLRRRLLKLYTALLAEVAPGGSGR
jgi:tetratricopeptide (TPR) repeat protein